MTFSYTGDPTVSDVDAVRFEIQDTDCNAVLLQDEEIAYTILQETGVAAGAPASIAGAALYSAAARCMEVLARLFGAQADTALGSLKTTMTKQAAQYNTRAQELRARASGMRAAPWSGGQSKSQKRGYRQNPDQVQPKFTRDEFNNQFGGSGRGVLPPMPD